MPEYRYRAVHSSGRVHKGRMHVAHEEALQRHLADNGLELVAAQALPARTGAGSPAAPAAFLRGWRRVGLSLDLLGRLCRQMEDLLRAGLTLSDALATVRGALPSGPARDRLEALARDLQHGESLARAASAPPRLFDAVGLATLAAGEASGDLAATFAALARHIGEQAVRRRDMRRALRYPLFLVAIALGVTAFMLALVVPEVVALLNGLGAELPASTRLLIAVSDGATAWSAWGLALLAGVSVGAWTARRFWAPAAGILDGLLLMVPFAGPLLRRFALARFAESLALLLRHGVGLPQALGVAAATLDNAALKALALDAVQGVQAGQTFGRATATLFPLPAAQILGVGERNGQLESALEETSRLCAEEARAGIAQALGALEPALTLFVGLMLAWVVLAVLGPVYGSLGQLSQGG